MRPPKGKVTRWMEGGTENRLGLEPSDFDARYVGGIIERMKVLFDIYHVQIMHGDVIRHLQQHKEYIAHYHTAGNPGRNEIDDTQEINYPPIMRAIVETGYQGYIGQEFVPLRDKVASLSQAVKICDV